MNGFPCIHCVLSKMGLGSTVFVMGVWALQTGIRILMGAAVGALCGWASLTWACRLLQNRGREERLGDTVQKLIIVAAGLCGGFVGYCTGGWLPGLVALALLTVALTVGVSDWLCRVIPNPTVLAIFAVKLLLIALSLLKRPGLPAFSLLSSLGGMVFCFALFFAPGIFGKQVGAGDIKLAAAMGFLLGFYDALLAVVIMGLLVIAYSLAQRQMPLLAFLKTNIPMGPFIAAGMVAAYLLPYMTL